MQNLENVGLDEVRVPTVLAPFHTNDASFERLHNDSSVYRLIQLKSGNEA